MKCQKKQIPLTPPVNGPRCWTWGSARGGGAGSGLAAGTGGTGSLRESDARNIPIVLCGQMETRVNNFFPSGSQAGGRGAA